MRISGDLASGGARTVLRLLAKGGSSGVLRLRSPGSRGRLVLSEGRVMQASLSSVPALGEALVARGVLEKRQVDGALSIQKRSKKDRPLGQILVEMGAVERGDVGIAIEEQIRQVVDKLLSWRDGSYAFEPLPDANQDPAFEGIAVAELIERKRVARGVATLPGFNR
ncbi:MAG: DUF4388 domain-containing protein [Planctomycetota bacterium]|jgi:hypothetical protein